MTPVGPCKLDVHLFSSLSKSWTRPSLLMLFKRNSFLRISRRVNNTSFDVCGSHTWYRTSTYSFKAQASARGFCPQTGNGSSEEVDSQWRSAAAPGWTTIGHTFYAYQMLDIDTVWWKWVVHLTFIVNKYLHLYKTLVRIMRTRRSVQWIGWKNNGSIEKQQWQLCWGPQKLNDVLSNRKITLFHNVQKT